MTVPTTPPPFSRSVPAQALAIRAMIWSPSTGWPVSSQMARRSASPSSAMPMSARYSFTARTRASGWVEPQSSLMLKPLGDTPSGITSAPSSYRASGATL